MTAFPRLKEQREDGFEARSSRRCRRRLRLHATVAYHSPRPGNGPGAPPPGEPARPQLRRPRPEECPRTVRPRHEQTTTPTGCPTSSLAGEPETSPCNSSNRAIWWLKERTICGLPSAAILAAHARPNTAGTACPGFASGPPTRTGNGPQRPGRRPPTWAIGAKRQTIWQPLQVLEFLSPCLLLLYFRPEARRPSLSTIGVGGLFFLSLDRPHRQRCCGISACRTPEGCVRSYGARKCANAPARLPKTILS